ncbi:MAG: aspartate carbamoyltransferase catalytic subunit [Atribacterota bacterium]
MSTWCHAHLLGIRNLSREDITYLLQKASRFREFLGDSPKNCEALQGYLLVNLFFEPSTRTRTSFEIAGKLLGMQVVNVDIEVSSLRKGESLRDTVLTLGSLRPDVLVVRHSASGVPEYLAQFSPFHIVNAGDGLREHPTQALLDLLTIQRFFHRFEGLRMAIVGDVAHSRVARSLAMGFKKLGGCVVVSGPPTLVPQEVEVLGVKRVFPVEEAIQNVDVVYLLRIQRERQDAGYFPSLKEYAAFFGLSEKCWETIKDRAVIMHPGPVNRGVEVSYSLVENGRSLIEEQVTCGLAVRMAVLETLIREGEKQWERKF